MGFSCGIVGLPNVGKSTLFNALTEVGVAAQNYPFCTIEPNVGIVPVPDLRLDQLATIVKTEKIIPTAIEIVDIAGLVKGAAKGEGLGNQFLANIRQVDAILQVVRCFDSDDIIHVLGKVNPQDDIEIINTELMLADLECVERVFARTQKKAKTGDKEIQAQLGLLDRLQQQLAEGKKVKALTFTAEEQQFVHTLQLLTAKPTLYVANVADTGFQNNPYLTQVEEYAASENSEVVSVSAAIEAEIPALSQEEKAQFLDYLGLTEPGLNRVIRAGYKLLGLQTYFTVGPKEIRAWTIHRGDTAVEAAGKIHSDFAKGFIRAEVIGFQDYLQFKGELGAKEAGKLRLEGKEYIVCDGDVMHFRFNV